MNGQRNFGLVPFNNSNCIRILSKSDFFQVRKQIKTINLEGRGEKKYEDWFKNCWKDSGWCRLL